MLYSVLVVNIVKHWCSESGRDTVAFKCFWYLYDSSIITGKPIERGVFMRFGYRFGLGIIIISVLLFFLPNYALADAIVTHVGGNPASVPEGHSVETVFSIGTDAWIAGSVTDAVLVINGNVYLEPTAQVDLVIDLGGHVYNSALKSSKTGV